MQEPNKGYTIYSGIHIYNQNTQQANTTAYTDNELLEAGDDGSMTIINMFIKLDECSLLWPR